MTDQATTEKDDDAEYEAHFNEFTGGDPVEATDDVVEEESEEHAPQEEVADDDVEATETDQDEESEAGEQSAEDTPESEESAEEKYKREVDEWKHKYNSDIGRVNAYQRKIKEQEEQLKRLNQPPAKPPQNSGMSEGEWEQLKEDYPDIAKGLESQINAIKQQSSQELEYLKGQIRPLEQQQQQQYHDTQMHQLETAHPDWRDVVQSAEYGSWLNNQPEEIQAFMQSQDAQRNIYLLNSFKSANQPKAVAQDNGLQQKRNKQLRQAQTVANRSSSNNRNVLSEDDYDASFDHYADRRDSRN